MILLFSLLVGCGWMEGSGTQTSPSGAHGNNHPPMTKNVMPEVCEKVFTANDANAFFQFAAGLPNLGDCALEDIHAKHSIIDLAYETRPPKPPPPADAAEGAGQEKTKAKAKAKAKAPEQSEEKFEKRLAKISVTPNECVKGEGGMVAGDYTLTGVDEARKVCPEAIDSLVQGFEEKRAPMASKPQ